MGLCGLRVTLKALRGELKLSMSKTHLAAEGVKLSHTWNDSCFYRLPYPYGNHMVILKTHHVM